MDAQTIELISNIGEIIAAATIIVSLIYVGFQVRQNTQTLRIATAQAQMEGISNITSNFVQSPTLAAIWAGGLAGVSNPRDDEIVQFTAQVSLLFRWAESSYFLWRDGAMDENQWQWHRQSITDLIGLQGVRESWEQRRHWYSGEFQDWVDSVAAGEDARTIYPQHSPPAETAPTD